MLIETLLCSDFYKQCLACLNSFCQWNPADKSKCYGWRYNGPEKKMGGVLKDSAENPLVSVVVPNYNYAMYLEDCLKSILNQSYLNIELILVDDGSTDNSIAVAKSCSERITVVIQAHQGVNAARNLGFKVAKGAYVAFCDSDDVWLPEKIKLQVDFLEANREIGLVYSGICIVDQDLGVVRNQDAKFAGDCSRAFLKHPSHAIVLLGASTALIRHELIEQIGLFDENMHGPGEDWDFFRRIAEKSLIDFIPQHLVLYRQHGISASRVPSHYYFEGNRKAMRNMYRQSQNISRLSRRYSWIKLHWSFIKYEMKNKHFYSSIQELIRAIGPINS